MGSETVSRSQVEPYQTGEPVSTDPPACLAGEGVQRSPVAPGAEGKQVTPDLGRLEPRDDLASGRTVDADRTKRTVGRVGDDRTGHEASRGVDAGSVEDDASRSVRVRQRNLR